MSFCADNAKVQSFVESCAAYNSDPVEGTIQMGSDGVPYVEGGTDGLTLNVDKSVAAVENAISGWTGGDQGCAGDGDDRLLGFHCRAGS